VFAVQHEALPHPEKMKNGFVKRFILSLLNQKGLAVFSPQIITGLWSTMDMSGSIRCGMRIRSKAGLSFVRS
jgi:hypothetical protein